MRALVFEQFGGPEVLHLGDVPDPVPAAGEVLVRTRAIGLNFADIYRRQGHYHLAGRSAVDLRLRGGRRRGVGTAGFRLRRR